MTMYRVTFEKPVVWDKKQLFVVQDGEDVMVLILQDYCGQWCEGCINNLKEYGLALGLWSSKRFETPGSFGVPEDRKAVWVRLGMGAVAGREIEIQMSELASVCGFGAVVSIEVVTGENTIEYRSNRS